MDTLSIGDWSNYFAVLAESASTLTGLVFVAVSINLKKVLSVPGLTGRAAESMMQLFGVVLISTTAMIPRQPAFALGTEVLAIALVLWLIQSSIQLRYLRSKTGHPASWLITRIAQTQIAGIPFCVGGILLILGTPAGTYWLAPGCIFSLIAGVSSAWVLLIEILR